MASMNFIASWNCSLEKRSGDALCNRYSTQSHGLVRCRDVWCLELSPDGWSPGFRVEDCIIADLCQAVYSLWNGCIMHCIACAYNSCIMWQYHTISHNASRDQCINWSFGTGQLKIIQDTRWWHNMSHEINGHWIQWARCTSYHSSKFHIIYYKVFKQELLYFTIMSVVHHWICQQPTMFQGFLQSRLKWGLNIEQLPCYHHYQAQSEVLTQSLGLVNAFSTATVLSNVGKLLMNSQKLRSFLRLVRHTFIRPDTPELWLVIDCFLLWWTAANICC